MWMRTFGQIQATKLTGPDVFDICSWTWTGFTLVSFCAVGITQCTDADKLIPTKKAAAFLIHSLTLYRTERTGQQSRALSLLSWNQVHAKYTNQSQVF